MSKTIVYCEIEFLNKFFERKNEIQNDLLSDNFIVWQSFIKFLLGNAQIVLNVTKEQFLEHKTNPFFSRILDLSTRNSGILYFKPETFEKIHLQNQDEFLKDIYNEILCLNIPENECNKIETNYGVICFGNESEFDKIGVLFNGIFIPFSKKDSNFKNWSFIIKLKLPFNSLIITDNYLLDNENEINNLIDLLNNFLPNRLEKRKIQITIFATEKAGKSTEYYKNIYGKIKKIRDRIDVSIFLMRSSDSFHDRNIITNYSWINAGKGFNVFKNNKVNIDSFLSFFPVTYIQKSFSAYNEKNGKIELKDGVNSVFDNLKSGYKRVIENYSVTGIATKIGDEFENKLLK